MKGSCRQQTGIVIHGLAAQPHHSQARPAPPAPAPAHLHADGGQQHKVAGALLAARLHGVQRGLVINVPAVLDAACLVGRSRDGNRAACWAGAGAAG